MESPPGGIAWRPPHGYSHHVAWDGEAVVKTFTNYEAGERERIALEILQGKLAVPSLLPSHDPMTLRMRYVDGTLAEPYVADLGTSREQRHRSFLTSAGSFIASLHRLSKESTTVLVHGDFAPYNVIVAPGGEFRAVIDWEHAHAGEPVEDLAWMEWNMRIWYSVSPAALGRMYRAFGARFPWNVRHEAMLARCQPHAGRARRGELPPPVADRWIEHHARTLVFEEILEERP